MTSRWLMVALLAAGSLACGPQREPREPEPGTPTLSVATYNVNFGLAGDEATLEAIAAAEVDVILLQETNESWAEAIDERFAARYAHRAFRHCCGAGGLGVLSKHPIVAEEVLEAQHGWFPAWRLVVATPIGRVQLLNLHLRPQLSESGSVVSGYFTTPPIREAEMRGYFPSLDPSLPTVIAGDFNEGASGRAIAYLEERGFRTALRQFDSSADTWRYPTSLGTIRTELDHLVYDQRLEPLQVRVIEAGRSDHLPVVGLFRRVDGAPIR